MKTNTTWHSKHRLPQCATMKERVRWHLAHAKHCGCRPIPASVQAYLRTANKNELDADQPPDRDSKRTDGQSAVVGVADHNGWAMLVTVAAIDGRPAVIDRRRVELIEKGLPSQPYHHETVGLGESEAEQLVRKVKRSVATCAALAFDRLSADLSPQYQISSVAIRQPPLDEFPATVADVHRSYYVFCRADAMLYHSAIVSDADRRGWPVLLHRRGEELARAADALRQDASDLERFINDLKSTLGPPWSAEHRNAFAAAIAGLII
jgi:hypothetical protein